MCFVTREHLRIKRARIVYHRTRMGLDVHFTYALPTPYLPTDRATSRSPYYLLRFFFSSLRASSRTTRTTCERRRATTRERIIAVTRLQNELFLAPRMCRTVESVAQTPVVFRREAPSERLGNQLEQKSTRVDIYKTLFSRKKKNARTAH